MLDVEAKNTPALRLYESLGFVTVNTSEYLFNPEAPLRVYRMVCTLTAAYQLAA